MSKIKSTVGALVAWYSLPESERSVHGKSIMPVDEKQELLKQVTGHLSAHMMAGDLAALLRMLWVAANNKKQGYS